MEEKKDSGEKKKGGPLGFLIIACAVHAFDVWLRYGTTPLTIGQSPGSPGIWILFFFIYALLWLDASTLDAFKGRISKGSLLWISVIAYLWGPFWSILPGYFPAIKYFAAFLLIIAPFWLIVVLFATQEYPKFSLIYSVIWLFLIVFALFPNIKDFAEQQGHPLPNSLTPINVGKFAWEKTKESVTNFYQITFVKIPAKVSEDIKRQIALATGDYYTGKVDSAAQKRLGVYFDNFHPTETLFYEDTPVTSIVTMKVETLDKPLNISVGCDAISRTPTIPIVGTAPGPTPANKILPRSKFNVITSDQYDIDCVWNKGVLRKDDYTLTLRAAFDFSTRAYIKSYIMDRERLREYRRQNVDPLAGVPDKTPVAIYTSGPVRVGMSLGQQPIALGQRDETLQSWGVTIENAWEGKVLGITDVFFFVPKGIAIADPASIGASETTCSAVPEEEKETCDDTLVNVYTLTAEERAKEFYKNLTIKNFRIPLKVTDPDKVLGKAPIAVQNFKTSIQYHYLLERSTTASVREVPAG